MGKRGVIRGKEGRGRESGEESKVQGKVTKNEGKRERIRGLERIRGK